MLLVQFVAVMLSLDSLGLLPLHMRSSICCACEHASANLLLVQPVLLQTCLLTARTMLEQLPKGVTVAAKILMQHPSEVEITICWYLQTMSAVTTPMFKDSGYRAVKCNSTPAMSIIGRQDRMQTQCCKVVLVMVTENGRSAKMGRTASES